MSSPYRILDEPVPGRLSHLSVNPLFPLLAAMLGGAWLSWPWFFLNSLAIGSANKKREIATACLGVAGAMGLVWLGSHLVIRGVLDSGNVKYAATVLIIWKLGVCYYLYATQARSFELHKYFGGPVRNGMLVVIGGALSNSRVLDLLGNFWALVLA